MNIRLAHGLIVALSVALCMLMLALTFLLSGWMRFAALSLFFITLAIALEVASRLLVGRTDDDPE